MAEFARILQAGLTDTIVPSYLTWAIKPLLGDGIDKRPEIVLRRIPADRATTIRF